MQNITSLLATSVVSTIFFAGIMAPASAQLSEPQSIEIEHIDNDLELLELLVTQGKSETTNENGWYASLAPSLVFGYPVDIESDRPVAIATTSIFPGGPAVVANIPIDISLDTETEFGISGAAGYRFDDARVELEVAYNNNVEGVTVNKLAEIPLDGDIESAQFMVNGYYDIPTKS